MNINIEFWQLIVFLTGLLGSFLGSSFALGKMLLSQSEKRLDERFDAQKEGRIATQKHWDAQFEALKAFSQTENKQWRQLERELMELKAALPIDYQRRDDAIRNQTVIEAKLDGFAKLIQDNLCKVP